VLREHFGGSGEERDGESDNKGRFAKCEHTTPTDAVGRYPRKATSFVERGFDKHGPDLQRIFYDWNGPAGASGKQKL